MIRIIMFCFAFTACFGGEQHDLPVSYKGRFRPLEVYARLANRQDEISDDLKMIPHKRRPAEWLDLAVLKRSDSNPSLFLDSDWENLKTTYGTPAFSESYFEAYHHLPPDRYGFPSELTLFLEVWYYRLPLANLVIMGYLASLFCFISNRFARAGWFIFGITFILHTGILALRILILGRPPVSNMADTLIYVPWIAVMAAYFLTRRFKSTVPVAAASALGAILLTLLEWTLSSNSLENVQAVLNSQFWLIVHVLMIVGSYGILILAGVIGHFVLIQMQREKNTALLNSALLQLIYFGIAFLIPGTILGGIWAAQSWGRFWDWDPKESWAFISACTYLLMVHAYRFNYIKEFGLAIGSIIGLMVISFTWYGVNYILGTGLHSYGFGSGGEIWYYGYILLEALFILAALILHRRKLLVIKKNTSHLS